MFLKRFNKKMQNQTGTEIAIKIMVQDWVYGVFGDDHEFLEVIQGHFWPPPGVFEISNFMSNISFGIGGRGWCGREWWASGVDRVDEMGRGERGRKSSCGG